MTCSNLALKVLNNETFSLVSSGSSRIPLQQTNNFTNSSNGGRDPVSNLAMRDTSKMPFTNVTKITRDILPNNAKISNSAKEMIQQCATKYITFVTKKAKERCQSEYRKIMNAEDLLWAIMNLGFDDSVGPLTTFLQRYRNIEGGDLFSHHAESTPHIINNGPTLDNGPNEPNPVPSLEMPQPPLSPPVNSSGLDFSRDPNTNMEMFDPNDESGIYLDEFGVGCSDDAFTNFDHSVLFKHDQM